MLGRDLEQGFVSELLRRARGGEGGSLVLVGEPGVGKSVLVLFAADIARDEFTVLSAAGIETESELPFAGLASLIAPITELLERLPAPRAAALRGAVGLAAAQNPERVTVYLATLDLLSAAASERPVLLLADDLHWLDGPSREAILFLARRATSVPVVVLAAVRTEGLAAIAGASIEQLEISGLPENAGVQLACEARPGLAPMVARELWGTTNGNPLALVEIGRLLTEQQASGRAPLEQPLPTGPRLQRVFIRHVAELPPATGQAC